MFDRFHDVQLANHSVRALVSVARLFLIVAPYKVKDGEWGTDEFALEVDFYSSLLSMQNIFLYHSKDDQFGNYHGNISCSADMKSLFCNFSR